MTTSTPEDVRALLNSQDLGDRLRAVNYLPNLEESDAFELVQLAIADPNARVRYAAVSKMDDLGQHDLQASTQILRDRLNDAEADVQAAAADSICALKLTDCFDDLQHLYQTTPEWLVKFSIVAALGELGNPQAFELLQDALNSGHDLLTPTAIGALGELGDTRAIPLLIPYAANSDWLIRYRVVQALGRLDGSEVRSTLEQLTQDPVEQVAQAAKDLLG
jgi:HEAT repeat protein